MTKTPPILWRVFIFRQRIHAFCYLCYEFCSDVGPKFGNQPNKTCKDSPVIRIFNYTCDTDNGPLVEVNKFKDKTVDTTLNVSLDDTLSQKWYNFLKDKGFDDDDKVCVYQPRVQVLDNWGWCTGECDKTYKDAVLSSVNKMTEGCYDDYPYKSSDLSKTDPQCALTKNEEGINQWKDFDNIIVVAPGE